MKYLLTLLVVLLIPTAALAKGECKEEKTKFCPELKKEELRACLSKHEAELSATCKEKLEAKAKKSAAKEKPADSPAQQSAPSTAPSTDTQPQPTHPDGEPQ
jgi:hypothetical protein